MSSASHSAIARSVYSRDDRAPGIVRALALGVIKNAIDDRDVEWFTDPDSTFADWAAIAAQPVEKVRRAAFAKWGLTLLREAARLAELEEAAA